MRLVLLGDPVAHSRSPAIHRAALAAVGLTGSYEARRVDRAGFLVAVDELRRGEVDGANVTMPHKRLAHRIADRLDADAARAGAVNTFVVDEGTVVGHNTDVVGIRRAWRCRGLPDDAPVLLLGAGGAAAAAAVALEGRRVTVAARRGDRARELVRRLGLDHRVGDWARPLPGAVVVNATPIGMHGEALPDGLLDEASGLFDMAYGSRPTPAVDAARHRGLPTVDGLDMLVAQAEASFALWTGVEPPSEVMRAAAG